MNVIEERQIAAVAIAFLILAIYICRNTSIYLAVQTAEEGKAEIHPVVVEFSGDVRNPGIYYLEEGGTVADLFEKAKEPPLDGCPSQSLRATRLNSGQRVELFRSNRKGPAISIGRMDPGKAFQLGIPMDVNSASPEALVLLPGIGPSLARSISNYRRMTGGLQNMAQLRSVPGIGAKKAERLEPLILFPRPVRRELQMLCSTDKPPEPVGQKQ